MNTLSIQVSESQIAFLCAQAAQEGWQSPSDYVQELIRTAERRKAWDALKLEMEKGIASGEPIAVTDSHWEGKKSRLSANHQKAND